MKKILKFIRQNIVGFIIGGVVFGSLGVYAASVISSGEVTYSNSSSGLSSTNVKGAIDELNTKATTKIKEAEAKCPDGYTCKKSWQLGDYVKMTPTSTSYTITAAMTGYTSNQTINPSELNLWRVISINSDGTIDLVSEYVSSNSIYFSGINAYQYYVSTLNSIASQYANSKYTSGTRYTGYNGQTSVLNNIDDLKSFPPPFFSGGIVKADEPSGSGDTLYTKDTELITKALGTLIAKNVNGTNASSYYISSRCSMPPGGGGYRYFARYVYTDGNINNTELFLVSYMNDYYANTVNYYLRPIITLKSNFSSTGSGTSSSPYVLS